MYELLIERRAERDIEDLPKTDLQRVVSHVRALAENPRPHGVRKIVGSVSDWRIRVGGYRVIYEIDDERKIVKIIRVRHRREVYSGCRGKPKTAKNVIPAKAGIQLLQ